MSSLLRGRRRVWGVVAVAAAAAVLFLVGVVVLLVGEPRRFTGASTVAVDHAAPLYLVPTYMPDGFELLAATDTTGSTGPPGTTSSGGSATGPSANTAAANGSVVHSPTSRGSAAGNSAVHDPLADATVFVFGDAAATDPLVEPALALFVTPGPSEFGQLQQGHDATTRQVTRNGRTISVISKRWWGDHGPELVLAGTSLPKVGTITVWGRNLTADQVVQVVATLPEEVFASAGDSGTGGGSARGLADASAGSPSWQQPVLAVLHDGSRLLYVGSTALLSSFGFTTLPPRVAGAGVSSLTYVPGGTWNNVDGGLVAVAVRPGGQGRLIGDRFFVATTAATMVNGHKAWMWHEDVSSDPARNLFDANKTIEWVQDGHVVHVAGSHVSFATLTKVAESLHQVSESEWKRLAAPVLARSARLTSPPS